jgi:hypothetical protein
MRYVARRRPSGLLGGRLQAEEGRPRPAGGETGGPEVAMPTGRRGHRRQNLQNLESPRGCFCGGAGRTLCPDAVAPLAVLGRLETDRKAELLLQSRRPCRRCIGSPPAAD